MRDSSGAKNQPQYAGTGVPADAADLSELGNYAAYVGNRKVGPTSNATTPSLGRTTATGADVWDGLEWFDTDLWVPFVRKGGAWVRQSPSYREFTFQRLSVTDDALFFLTLTEVTAKASNPAFSYAYVNTGPDNGKLTLEAGNYEGMAAVHMGAATSGTSFAQVRNTSVATDPIGRAPVAYPADPYAVVPFSFRANGTDAIIFEGYKHTNSSTTLSGTLRLWKIGEL